MGTIRIQKGEVQHQHLGKWITIGHADFAKRILTVRRDRDKHFMKIHEGYGFNKELIESDEFFDYVAIEETNGEEKSTYFVPREDIVLHGKLYQAEGYDRQLFLSLQQIEKYKIE